MKRIEKILFWVIGYADTSDRVTDIIRTLRAGANEFAAVAKAPEEEIKTLVVKESAHFKHMRVFYVKTDDVPETAFHLGKDWSMLKWLSC